MLGAHMSPEEGQERERLLGPRAPCVPSLSMIHLELWYGRMSSG